MSSQDGQLDVDSALHADLRTLLALAVAVLVGAVATAAGVGGGAIYIPLFNALVGFALKPSTALSQACITAGSLAALATNLPQPHPSCASMPIIDFPLMVMLTPVLLVGVGIGVLLNVMLPAWLLTILLLVLLLLLTAQAVTKGRTLWRQESARKQAALAALDVTVTATSASVYTSAGGAAAEDGGGGTEGPDDGGGGRGAEGRQALLDPDRQDSAHAPPPAVPSPSPSAAPVTVPRRQRRQRGVTRGVASSGSRQAAAAAAAAAADAAAPLPLQPMCRQRLRGLQPEEDMSLGCLEGVYGGEVPAEGNDDGRRGGGGGGGLLTACFGGAGTAACAAADASLDCMEGLPPPPGAVILSRPIAVPGRPVADGDGDGGDEGGVASGRTEPLGGLPLPSAPSSARRPPPPSPGQSLSYAASWRAFNELGVVDYGETDDDAGAPPRRQRSSRASDTGQPSTLQSPFGLLRSLSPFPASPPPASGPSSSRAAGASSPSPFSSRLLPSLLLRRRDAAASGSGFGSGAAAAAAAADAGGGGLARLASFDPRAGLLMGGAAGTGAGADSWLERRSKWRKRFPPSALPHRAGVDGGADGPANLPANLPPALPRPPSSAAALPPRPPSRTGSTASRQRSRALWPPGGSDAAELDLEQPLLGPDPDLDPAAATAAGASPPDPRVGHGPERDGASGAAAGGSGHGGDRLDANSPSHAGGSGGSSSSNIAEDGSRRDAGTPQEASAAAAAAAASSLHSSGWEGYRPPTPLETLHEEGDGDASPTAAGPTRSGGTSGQSSPWSRQPRSSGITAALAAQAQARALRPAAAAPPARVPSPDGDAHADGVLPSTLNTQHGSKTNSGLDSVAVAEPVTPSRQPLAPTPPLALQEPSTPPTLQHRSTPLSPSADSSAHADADADGVLLGLRDDRQGSATPAASTPTADGGAAAAAAAAAAEAAKARSWSAAVARIPLRYTLALLAAWALYLGLQVLRAFQPRCTPAWWGLFATQVCSMLGISIAAVVGAAAEQRLRSRKAEEAATLAAADPERGAAAEADPDATAAVSGAAALLVLAAPVATLAATFAAGLAGGLLGLGGGMVMGPLLLHIGVQPQVTAATSGAMVLFSSSSALAQFALLRRLNGPYAAAFGAASLVAGLAGTHAVGRAVRRSGRPSLVVLALAGVMASGTLSVAVFGLRRAVEDLRQGDLGFAGLCDSR